ncbi:MAG: alanine--tRNA ligase [Actinomycetota bacterium]|nr:alanine--tRNA ligase [Actinomycetota bacterium]
MDLRKKFLGYFEKKKHMIMPSSELIPHDDPSVLLTTAGMQQFKPYFMGIKKPPGKRIATVQKCFRTSDIDEVGYTDRHLTFFEMLGNFSFGDYSKKEAIEYSLDFLLNDMGIQMDKLAVAVFKGNSNIPADSESINYWEKSGIAADKIYKFGKEDNFWGPAGDTGPCGPCSEIYYDFGKEYGCGRKDCGPDCDCGRFLEVWNLVFTEYNFDGNKFVELPSKNIDTGMGLERLTAVLDGNPSVFRTGLFKGIVKRIEELSGERDSSKSKKHREEFNRSVKVIADHARAIYFLISDGVVPSNEGRGYILRRIIRRAIRYGKLIKIKDNFLNIIGESVIKQYSKWYPELLEKKEFSFKLVSDEERRFTKTLNEGSKVLVQKVKEVKDADKQYINPEDAFRLYDTFGFPVELTREILNENKIKIDLGKFDDYLKEHTKKSKKKSGTGGKINMDIDIYRSISKKVDVEFSGYQKYSAKTSIEAILKVDKDGNKKLVPGLSEGDKGELILRETPFYGEKGGEAGDRGIIRKDKSIFSVGDCTIPFGDIYTHIGTVKKGGFKTGDKVSAEVDRSYRRDISKNHTATHILQWVLRSIFGDEIKQAGSFVGEDRFRFDYSIYNAPSGDDIKRIESIVNEKIQSDDPVRCFETTREYAKEIGAMALFDEKYGKFVRVVEIDNYSRELCGGIHVRRTGEIGLFKIISESSVGANLRRIEALTGMHAYKYITKKDGILKKVAESMGVDESELTDTIDKLKNSLKEKEEEMASIRLESAKEEILKKSGCKSSDSGLKTIDYDFSKSDVLKNMGISDIGKVADEIKSYFRGVDTLIIFGSKSGSKPVIIISSTKDIVKKGIHCGRIAGEIAKKLNGGGGGKPHYAQMGFSGNSSIKMAIGLVRDKVLDILKEDK